MVADRQTASSIRLARLLETHDCAGLKELFHAFFASIPYQWYADYEGFSASVFYSYFAALGYEVAVEESSSHAPGPCAPPAMSTCSSSRSPRPPGSALAQLQQRRYADKYRARRRRRIQPHHPQHHRLRSS